MVTGSHIPFDRNGLKFYRPDGEITKADEISILNQSEKFDFLNTRLTELTESSDANNTYIKRYTDLFDSNVLKGKKIGIYEHSSAGRDIYRDLFEELGAEVISLDRSSNFVPIDTEAVSQLDKEKAATWSKEFCLDAIFSTDGDRPLVADENGNWMCGDLLGLLASKLLKIEAVVIPVSCNTSIERSAFFQEVIRTKIGSPYVISEFNKLKQKFKLIARFEANGGYILGSDILVNGRLLKALPTRDALLPALLVFAESETISKLQNLLPDRFTGSDRLINFNRVNSDCLLSSIKNDPSSFLEKLKINTSFAHLDSLDGLRLRTKEGDVIHLRPSGNAPELRCYSESKTKLKAELLVKNVFSFVKFQQIKI
jgi:phosphomannomutase